MNLLKISLFSVSLLQLMAGGISPIQARVHFEHDQTESAGSPAATTSTAPAVIPLTDDAAQSPSNGSISTSQAPTAFTIHLSDCSEVPECSSQHCDLASSACFQALAKQMCCAKLQMDDVNYEGSTEVNVTTAASSGPSEELAPSSTDEAQSALGSPSAVVNEIDKDMSIERVRKHASPFSSLFQHLNRFQSDDDLIAAINSNNPSNHPTNAAPPKLVIKAPVNFGNGQWQ